MLRTLSLAILFACCAPAALAQADHPWRMPGTQKANAPTPQADDVTKDGGTVLEYFRTANKTVATSEGMTIFDNDRDGFSYVQGAQRVDLFLQYEVQGRNVNSPPDSVTLLFESRSSQQRLNMAEARTLELIADNKTVIRVADIPLIKTIQVGLVTWQQTSLTIPLSDYYAFSQASSAKVRLGSVSHTLTAGELATVKTFVIGLRPSSFLLDTTKTPKTETVDQKAQKLTVEYDRFKDVTSYILEPSPTSDPTALFFAMFQCQGHTECTPGVVVLAFAFITLNDTPYQGQGIARAIRDGVRQDPYQLKYLGIKPVSLLPAHLFIADIRPDSLIKIANSKLLEYQLDSAEFALTPQNLAGLRTLASRMR